MANNSSSIDANMSAPAQVSTCPGLEIPPGGDVYITALITIILNIILSITAITSNLLVVIAVSVTQELRTISNILLLTLSITDLLVGFISHPLFVVVYLNVVTDQECLALDRDTYQQIAFIPGALSFTTLSLISVERYFAIFYPFQHETYFSKERVFAATTGLWVFGILVVSSKFMGLSSKLYGMLMGVLIIISTLISAFVYMRIFKVAYRHSKQIHSQEQSVSNRNTSQAREMRTAKTMSIILGAILACYCPGLASLFISAAKENAGSMLRFTLFPWTDTIIYLNSSLNPLIYCLRHRRMRTVVMTLSKQCLRFRRIGTMDDYGSLIRTQVSGETRPSKIQIVPHLA